LFDSHPIGLGPRREHLACPNSGIEDCIGMNRVHADAVLAPLECRDTASCCKAHGKRLIPEQFPTRESEPRPVRQYPALWPNGLATVTINRLNFIYLSSTMATIIQSAGLDALAPTLIATGLAADGIWM